MAALSRRRKAPERSGREALIRPLANRKRAHERMAEVEGQEKVPERLLVGLLELQSKLQVRGYSY